MRKKLVPPEEWGRVSENTVNSAQGSKPQKPILLHKKSTQSSMQPSKVLFSLDLPMHLFNHITYQHHNYLVKCNQPLIAFSYAYCFYWTKALGLGEHHYIYI